MSEQPITPELLNAIRESLPAFDPNRISGSSDGNIAKKIESDSMTWTRISIIIFEIIFVLFLLYVGYLIYKHPSGINISTNRVQILDAFFYILIALFMFYLLCSKGKYHSFDLPFDLPLPTGWTPPTTKQINYASLVLMFLLILLYFVFNCIWLVKAGVKDITLQTYFLLLIASLTSLIPLFIIEYNYDDINENKTYSSLLIMLFALGSMISGALMILDPNFISEYVNNTMIFSKDVKDDKQLEVYNFVIIVSGFLTMLIIFPIINILVNGLNAQISIIFLVIISILILILAIYLCVMTKKLFSTTEYPKILNATTTLLSIGIVALFLGTFSTVEIWNRTKNPQTKIPKIPLLSSIKSLGMPVFVIKFGICCIAVAQCLIGYFLYPLYETPTTSE